jgi:hypothetical protein
VDKSDLTPKVEVPKVEVMPRTLIIRPMQYKHPIGLDIYFSGVFGNDADSKEAGDVWVATFFDRNEAEAFLMASKAFGQTVKGVRMGLKGEEHSGVERIPDSTPPTIIS